MNLLPLLLLGAAFSGQRPGGGVTATSPLTVSNGNVSCPTCVAGLAAVGASPNGNGASLSGNTLTLQPADATHPGALLAADWVTFNAKQAALSASSPLVLTGSTLSCATCVTTATTTGTNTGDVTLGAVGSSPSANGASLSGQVLALQPADSTHPGVLTTAAQTISGQKSFSNTPVPASDNGAALGSPSSRWSTGYFNTLMFYGGGVEYNNNTTPFLSIGGADSNSINLNDIGGDPGGTGIAVALGPLSHAWASGNRLLKISNAGTDDFSVFDNGNATAAGVVSGAKGLRAQAQTLGTCSSGIEGQVEFDALSGVATGNPTRLCLCRSNGSSTYAWLNLASNTLGTTTTCPN